MNGSLDNHEEELADSGNSSKDDSEEKVAEASERKEEDETETVEKEAEEEMEVDEEQEQEESAEAEEEIEDIIPVESLIAESLECESEENNVSAVLSPKNIHEETDTSKESTNETMEIDERSENNSDVECLDTHASEIIEDDKIDLEDEDEKNMSTGSSVQQINESIETVDCTIDTPDLKICEENGSCGSSPDIEEIIDSGKSNGHNSSQERSPKKKPRKQIDLSNITPRRSSRNIKRTSYIEKEPEEEPEDAGSSDIEEIKPEDPLACIVDVTKDKENSKLKSPIKSNKTTIVVNDTKRLVEIAAGSKSSKGGKKEPTLVIIDTNSILSGRGGLPMSSGSSTSYGGKSSQQQHHHQQQQHHHQQQQQQQQQHHHHHSISSAANAFSVLPMGHTQTMYPNMRTTITPVPMTSRVSQPAPKPMPVAQPPPPQPQPSPPQQILPTLTDDMFVVEAPSFIVPYVYEKPPLKPLKDFVTKLEKSIAEVEKEEKEEKARKIEAKKIANAKDVDADVAKSDDGDSDDGSVKNKPDIEDTFDLTERGGEDKNDDKNKVATYFDLPLGKFFMQIGVNLVQEFVQTDLLRTQKRKQGKHGTASAETQIAINSLIKNLEFSKENNEPFHLEMKKCEFCNFKTESALVMQHHLETPHMRNYVYKCNFCPLEVRSPHDILFHMEAEHNTRGRLERGPAFHQCPNCPFEDNQKGKLTRHILACAKKFRPERNLEPANDWEPPAKIPRLNRPRQVVPVNASAIAMAMGAKGTQPLLPKLLPAPVTGRGRGRPPMHQRYSDVKSLRFGSGTTIRQGSVFAFFLFNTFFGGN